MKGFQLSSKITLINALIIITKINSSILEAPFVVGFLTKCLEQENPNKLNYLRLDIFLILQAVDS